MSTALDEGRAAESRTSDSVTARAPAGPQPGSKPPLLDRLNQSRLWRACRRVIAHVRACWRRCTLGLVKWFAEHRGLLDLLLSVLGVVIVAFVSIWLESVVKAEAKDAGNVALLWGLVLLILGMVLLRIRSRIAYERGTLFYLRLLAEYMTDRHNVAREARQRGHAEHKIIARWINPHAKQGTVVDLTPEVEAITAETERCLNEDTSQTGTQLAPNLLWPAAMAIGYDVAELAGDTVEFVELGDRPLDWKMVQVNLGESYADGLRIVWAGKRRAPEQVKLVTLLAELTGLGAAHQHPWQSDVVGRLAVLSDANPQAVFDVSNRNTSGCDVVLLTRLPSKQVEVRTNRTGGSVEERTGRDGEPVEVAMIRPQVAARKLWRMIRDTLHSYPNAHVLLNLRVPKTVALATGALLARDGKSRESPGCGEECALLSCRHPWERLIPVNYVEGAQPPYEVHRVHRSQPSVSALNAILHQRSGEPA